MMLKKMVPDFVKVFLKKIVYRFYLLSLKLFKGPFDAYDFQAIRIFRSQLKPDSNCIDIGAHAGHILREIWRAAPRGQHIAVEPLPHLFRLLEKKFGNRLSLYNYALSDQEGQVSFTYYPDRPALSGFRERSQAGGYKPVPLEVQTRRLDDLVPADRKIDLIKIDVEGAEYQVLKGARRILRESHPIVLFEFGLGGADEYGTRPEELFDLFADAGLSVGLMEYFLEGKKPFSREEFCGQFYKSYNYFFIAYRSE